MRSRILLFVAAAAALVTHPLAAQHRCDCRDRDRDRDRGDDYDYYERGLPRSYLGGMLKRVEIVASDVPGVPCPVWLAGARITGHYAFGPTIGAAVNATLMSYAGVCHIGVNIDTRAIEDPELWLTCLELAVQDVISARG